MKIIVAALLLLTTFSSAALAQQPGPGQPGQPPGSQDYRYGPQDYRRGGDQIGSFAQMSDLLRADYRIVAAYDGGLVVTRNDRVFVCTFAQFREGAGGGSRLFSQGCSEVREARNRR